MNQDPSRIMDMASAFYRSQVLFTASDLGVFEALRRGRTATAPTLADESSSSVRGMQLLLDACVAVGLLTKAGDRYGNSAEAEAFLVPGAPGDLSRALRYNRDVYQAWGQLETLVRTGSPVEAPTAHLGDDDARTRTFVESMRARAKVLGRMIVPRLDLSGCRRVLDVGGGPGTYSVLLAQAYPGLECVVLDLPAVVSVAEELIRLEAGGERVSTLAADYRNATFPGENDAVLLFGILHQESPASIRSLLRKSLHALRPGGMVHILDIMTDSSHAHPPFSALFAVNMALTAENGWVFSGAELEEWLQEAGFAETAVRSLPPPIPHWLATAVRPDE